MAHIAGQMGGAQVLEFLRVPGFHERLGFQIAHAEAIVVVETARRQKAVAGNPGDTGELLLVGVIGILSRLKEKSLYK